MKPGPPCPPVAPLITILFLLVIVTNAAAAADLKRGLLSSLTFAQFIVVGVLLPFPFPSAAFTSAETIREEEEESRLPPPSRLPAFICIVTAQTNENESVLRRFDP